MPHVRARMLVRRDEPPATVEQAARDALDVRGPAGGPLTTALPEAAANGELTVTVAADGAGSIVTVDADTDFNVPFFWWAIGPLVNTALKRSTRHAVASIDAALTGAEPPPPPKSVKALPNVAF